MPSHKRHSLRVSNFSLLTVEEYHISYTLFIPTIRAQKKLCLAVKPSKTSQLCQLCKHFVCLQGYNMQEGCLLTWDKAKQHKFPSNSISLTCFLVHHVHLQIHSRYKSNAFFCKKVLQYNF